MREDLEIALEVLYNQSRRAHPDLSEESHQVLERSSQWLVTRYISSKVPIKQLLFEYKEETGRDMTKNQMYDLVDSIRPGFRRYGVPQNSTSRSVDVITNDIDKHLAESEERKLFSYANQVDSLQRNWSGKEERKRLRKKYSESMDCAMDSLEKDRLNLKDAVSGNKLVLSVKRLMRMGGIFK